MQRLTVLHRVFSRGAGASRYLKFTIDIDINGVEDAQESIRCDTFVILEHEKYIAEVDIPNITQGGVCLLSIDNNSSGGLYRNVRS